MMKQFYSELNKRVIFDKLSKNRAKFDICYYAEITSYIVVYIFQNQVILYNS